MLASMNKLHSTRRCDMLSPSRARLPGHRLLLNGLVLNGLLLTVFAGCKPPVTPVIQPAGEVAQAVQPIAHSAADWPAWRGARGDNQAQGPLPPLQWSETENVLWKADVPGRGHATPIVVGDRVLVATADEADQRQLLLAYDRATGKPLWERELHRGGFMRKHDKNSHASATPACDGKRVYAAYIADQGLWVSAVDMDGELVWQSQAGPFQSLHGYGASPVLFESLVIVAGDSAAGGFIAALHRDSGEVVWRQRRSNKASFGTPLLVRQDERWQLLHSGNQELTSYDPATGEILWTTDGPASTTANTPVHMPGLVVVTGGYPQRAIMGIRADGSGEVLWNHAFKAYVPSPLLLDTNVLVVQDNGVARLYEAESGEQLWLQRLAGDFSASPTRAGPYVLLPSEGGKVYVLQPTATACKIVAENQLSGGIFASPVVCAGRLYVRTLDSLYCIGESEESSNDPPPTSDSPSNAS
jgi:outer membrane protein assembly factor BamB